MKFSQKPFEVHLFDNTVAQRQMYEFCEANKRGGITMVPGRYSRAKTDCENPVDIAYIDATNLYGWAMSQKLPVGQYKWWGKGQWDMDNVFHKDMMYWSDSQDPDMPTYGWWVECDLMIPDHLHDYFKDYPPAPTKRVVKEEELSPYQVWLLKELDQKHDDKTEKLILDLLPKKLYGGHLRLLQLWMKLGVVVTKVHRVLRFQQYTWMKSYIDGNTEQRRNTNDAAKKDFYKLMNNSCYGKFLQDDRKHRNIHVVTGREEKREKKLLNSPFFESADIIREDITLIHHRKKHVDLNKPVIVGVTILELSKLRMYEMWYLTLKKCFGDRLKLLMTDTDSFVIEVKRHPDHPNQSWIEELVRSGYSDEFDLSVYPDDHPAVLAAVEMGLDPKKNKGVLGKFKDETPDDPIHEFIGLRPKMYAYRTKNGSTNTRAKGVKRSVKDSEMDFTMYAKALMNETSVVQQRREMMGIRSIGHQLHTYRVDKKLISPTDSKLWVSGPFDTLPFGHYNAIAEESKNWVIPSECNISEELGGSDTDCTVEHHLLNLCGESTLDLRCLFCRANTELHVPSSEEEERIRGEGIVWKKLGVPGLSIARRVFSSEEQQQIVQSIDEKPWSETLSRRTQHYGMRYDYRLRTVVADSAVHAIDSCKSIERLRHLLAPVFEERGSKIPNQCIVNEYLSGQSIGPHTDAPCFGPVIASLSLGEATTIVFMYASQVLSLLLEPGDLLVMEGRARNLWKHYTTPVTLPSYRRISCTFRTVI